jgi:GDPmannose 4,6-dehydratase
LQLDTAVYLKQDPALLRPVDLEIIYGDNTKAKTELGWNYNITNNELIQKLIVEEEKFIEWELAV